MSRSCLCSARLSPNLAKPSTLLDFARALGGKVTDAGLSSRPLQFTSDESLFVFAYSLVDVVFEPSLFGCHLKPQDARARLCAYCSQNPRGSSAVFIFRRENHIGMSNPKFYRPPHGRHSREDRSALAETRAAFDGANQLAREAFKRASA